MASGESKIINLLEDEVIPALEQETSELVGSDIAWLVDWDSFQENPSSLKYVEKGGFLRIIEALQEVCVEENNTDLMALLVSTVLVRNVDDEDEVGVDLNERVLEITGAWHIGEDGWPEVEELKDSIELLLNDAD